jgi:hypothetical protein
MFGVFGSGALFAGTLFLAVIVRLFGLAGRHATSVGYLLSLAITASGWLALYEPKGLAAALSAIALGTFFPLKRWRRRIRLQGSALGHFPRAVRAAVAAFPTAGATAITSTVDTALRDYVDLKRILSAHVSPQQRQSVLGSAEKTLLRVLTLAHAATNAHQVAQSRPDSRALQRSETVAIEKLRELTGSLHEAVEVIAADATERKTGAQSDLKEQIERLRLLAEVREELDLSDVG